MLTATLQPSFVRRPSCDFAALRAREFARLDAEHHAYLDFTGSALHPDSLVASHLDMLRHSVLGNPHAESPASLASTALVAEARAHVLHFLDADPDEYEVVFVANATAAIQLVASSFRFGADAPLILAADNHNSVNGMREYARRAGASVYHLPLDDELQLAEPEERLAALTARSGGGLFAYPAQSNFSGVKHALSLVRCAQRLGHRVLLDAAAFVPTSRLSLREVPADFVALSFYKMFDYPTGVGALVARRDALPVLHRPWFSGGTVEFVSVQGGLHLLRAGADGFEDGTANFLGIGAVPAGLAFLETLGVDRIESHVDALATTFATALGALRHRNGSPVTRLYGPSLSKARGATIAFNVLDDAGVVVPYAVVEERARAARVSVRGGCFCNPGASEAAFGFPLEATQRCLVQTRDTGWSIPRFAACMKGYAVGAVRASFGIPSNERDLWRLVEVVESFSLSS
ncbi:MAG: aminotransferase class [Gemmatimonadetes bacterium]|nr:aminotransferase class [Gemmatimonadota bacterium]